MHAAALAAAIHYAAGEADYPLPLVNRETWGNGEEVVYLQSPFRQLPRPVELPTASQIRGATVREVPLQNLYGSQLTVTWNGITKDRDDSHGLPIVIRSNGVNYIQDGHHRLTKQLLDGDQSAKVRFVDLDRD